MRTGRNHRFSAVAAMLIALMGLAAGEWLEGATLVVTPGGKDGNPGTKEQPLATLEAARDAARKAGPGPHRLVVMPGEYFLSKTLELDARDNGLTIEAHEAGKAVLYGGTPVTGWRRDGDRFWCADLPGVKEGTWDFRALVVNGRMPERARLPESGTFLHRSVFDVHWLTSVGGGWERKPTREELTTMLYDPKDIPATLDARNAEVRVYHMWDESLVGIARNDTDRHALLFSTPAVSPPGAFGIKKYVVWNVREGMTRPGQWYLDRSAGKVVYWPLPDEDMARAKVVAPRLERLLRIAGNKKRPVENVTIRGLVLQATTTPLKAGGFGAGTFDGALGMEWARLCTMEGLEICNVGGQGILSRQLTDCRIVGCHIHHTGACGIKAEGAATLIGRNHIHHVGVFYPSAVALSAGHHPGVENEKGLHIWRNEIHDAPYSGIVAGGGNHLIEENLISRVMRELQDGAAIYGGITNSVLRGNIVRDVVKMGEGYGVSAYYLDEGARDCIIERNVSVGVERPTHNHIAWHTIIRDNVFIADGDMSLTFARSTRCTFEGNTLFVPGKLTVTPTNAIKVWKGNVIFHNGLAKDGAAQAFTIDDALPSVSKPQGKRWTLGVVRVGQPPAIDGEVGPDEWPGQNQRLDRDSSRQSAAGPPVFVKLCYDDRFLYVAASCVAFEPAKLRTGAEWGKDDAAELAIAGKTADGRPAGFVIRGFAGGTLRSVTDGGAPASDAQRVGKAVRFAAKVAKTRGGWRGEFAIPFEGLGLVPAPGLKVAFNLSVFQSEYEEMHCWEGTLAETWRLEQAGTLQLK